LPERFEKGFGMKVLKDSPADAVLTLPLNPFQSWFPVVVSGFP